MRHGRDLGVLLAVALAVALVDALTAAFAVGTTARGALVVVALGAGGGLLVAAATTVLPRRPQELGVRSFVVCLAAFATPWLVALHWSQ